MADLKTNYVDDILDGSVNDKRRYRMVQNADGTFSFDDVTTYMQNGDTFGAKDINDTNTAVNELNKNLSNLPTGTLSSGSTSVTIADTSIKADGLIDIYTDVYGVNPTSVDISDGSITITFDIQESDIQVKVRCL